jgi:GNAT superfamily N-acetyltransferase
LPADLAAFPTIGECLGSSTIELQRNNPDTTDATPCLFCLIDDQGKVVSSIKCIADTLTIDDRPCPWIWTGGLQTDPTLRGMGLATRLQRESTEWTHRQGYGRGSVFSTEITLHIYRKLGYALPGFVPRYLLLSSLRPVIEAHIASPGWRRVARLAALPLLAAVNPLSRYVARRMSRSTELVELHAGLHGEFERLTETIMQHRRVHFNMSAQKLHWKVHCARRQGQVSVYLLQDARDRDFLGYAILRTRQETQPLAEKYRDFSCMTLMDYAVVDESPHVYSELLGRLVELFHRSRAEVLQIISNSPSLNRLAFRCGLLRIGKGMSFAYSMKDTEISPSIDLQQMDAWPVTHFSGDAFAF